MILVLVVVGAKTFRWPLSKAQKTKRFDDALISLFSPIHETFRVFCDARKNVEKLHRFSSFSSEKKNEFTCLNDSALFLSFLYREEEINFNFH